MRMFRDLLFLHGHVADIRLARELDRPPACESTPASPLRSAADATETPASDAGACDLRPVDIANG